jgi:DNA end-binding protein Ku
MRAIWKGAVSFGLVNVPVRVFGATQEHDIRFHQVHRVDGGRIHLKRVCTVCGEEVPDDQLAKGYESPDGRTAVLTEEDFSGLPLSTSREVTVLEFVPKEQVDPILFNRAYYLEPEARATKPYVLLREALEATDRVAVVKVALRQREALAVLRVRERVIVLQTLLWPDEIRTVDFDVLDSDVDLHPQESAMAESLVESLSADFQPDQYCDQYARAVAALVETKLELVEKSELEGSAPTPEPASATSGDEVANLLTTLRRSVEQARAAREERKTSAQETAQETEAPAKKPEEAPAKKPASMRAATKKAAPRTNETAVRA